jgi:hypothetical protein
VVKGFELLTLDGAAFVMVGRFILVLEDLAGLLFAIITELAIRLFETEVEVLKEAGVALPRTLAEATFKKTGFEFTIIPKCLALVARFCGERSESTCC